MDFESKTTAPTATNNVEFPPLATSRKPLEILQNTEALLRRPTVAKLTPLLPPKLGNRLQIASTIADESLTSLAQVDLEQISDIELRPPRIFIGLSFVGFGALMVLILVLYLNTLHPELNTVEQIRQYWYQYIWCVSLGVAGMFLLGREAMRPQHQSPKVKK